MKRLSLCSWSRTFLKRVVPRFRNREPLPSGAFDAATAELLRAPQVLEGEPAATGMTTVPTVGRLECQIDKLMEQGSIAQWIRHVRKTAVTGIRWPTPTGYIFTERSQIHLDLGPRHPALPPPPTI